MEFSEFSEANGIYLFQAILVSVKYTKITLSDLQNVLGMRFDCGGKVDSKNETRS